MLKKCFLFSAIFASVVMSSCKKEENIATEKKTGSFVLSDFPQEKVLKGDDYKSALETYGVGNSDSNALVPLLFDKNGILYTGEKYNAEANDSNVVITRYVTDLKTFKDVTGFEYATKDYAKGMLMGENKVFWIFDPYQKFYTPSTSDQSSLIENSPKSSSLKASTSITVSQGDLLYAPDGAGSAGVYLGHVAGFYSLPPVCGDVNALMSGATVIEADWLKVYKRLMKVYWTGHTGIRVIQYRYGLTSAQRTTIITYLNNQVGEPYSFSLKTNESSWYCSKLVWKAYKQVNIDIDYDGGAEVTPTDILNSPLLYGYTIN